MNSVSGRASPAPSESMPVHLKKSDQATVAATAAAIPTASAVAERLARSPRRSTVATQKPAIGPNSGPTTIAPTIRS